MIPKIIHYVWLGHSPIPKEMQKCMDSWEKHMPDYRIKCWDDSSLNEVNSVFVQEALQEKKYAFASDVIRLYAIYKYGGIYMDTDVMVYRSFDTLLGHHAFIGRENSMHQIGQTMEVYLTTCCLGAEKGNHFIKRCLDYYEDRHFITSKNKSLPVALRMDMTLNSYLFTVFAKEIGFNSSVLADYIQRCQDDILTIYPQRYFDATKHTADIYTKHLALGTWREEEKRVYTYSWKYKIEWRIRALVEWLLKKNGYIMVKMEKNTTLQMC